MVCLLICLQTSAKHLTLVIMFKWIVLGLSFVYSYDKTFLKIFLYQKLWPHDLEVWMYGTSVFHKHILYTLEFVRIIHVFIINVVFQWAVLWLWGEFQRDRCRWRRTNHKHGGLRYKGIASKEVRSKFRNWWKLVWSKKYTLKMKFVPKYYKCSRSCLIYLQFLLFIFRVVVRVLSIG